LSFFARSGNRSGQAKSILEQNGFVNVTNGGTWQDVNTILKKISTLCTIGFVAMAVQFKKNKK
jgi:hypothetical protein